jgi:hypothetical protein
MSQCYDLKKIKALLTEVFTDDELVCLCYDHFTPVYEHFKQRPSKAQLINQLITHADQNSLLETLLDLIKKHNRTIYEKYQPHITSSKNKLSQAFCDPVKIGLVIIALACVAALTFTIVEIIPTPTITPTPDCSGIQFSYLVLDSSTDKYSENDEIKLKRTNIVSRNNLTGRAVLTIPTMAKSCKCIWEGRTIVDSGMRILNETPASNCIFSIDLPNQAANIQLKLTIQGGLSLDFLIQLE